LFIKRRHCLQGEDIYGLIVFAFQKYFKKYLNFLFFSLLLINIFLIFLDYFDALVSKIIFKKIKKHNFDIFSSKKQPQPYSQTSY
jgi:cell shape-determining protein MreD